MQNNYVAGTDLTKKFQDQFHPMLMYEDEMFSIKDSTIIRMPLSSRLAEEYDASSTRVETIFNQFIDHGSSTILSLKSVMKVSEISFYDFPIRNV